MFVIIVNPYFSVLLNIIYNYFVLWDGITTHALHLNALQVANIHANTKFLNVK